MRSYTLALLSRLNSSSGLPVLEAEIVQWTNQRLEAKVDISVYSKFFRKEAAGLYSANEWSRKK